MREEGKEIGLAYYGKKNWIGSQQAFDCFIKEMRDYLTEEHRTALQFFKFRWEARLEILDKMEALGKEDNEKNYLTAQEFDKLVGTFGYSVKIYSRHNQYFPESVKKNLKKIGASGYCSINDYGESKGVDNIKKQNNFNLGFYKFKPELAKTEVPFTKVKPGDLVAPDINENGKREDTESNLNALL